MNAVSNRDVPDEPKGRAEAPECSEAPCREGASSKDREVFRCPDAVVLAGYLDGKLGEEEVERFEAHLASCAKCRLEVDELREILAEGEIEPRTPESRRAMDDLIKKAKGLLGE